MVALMVVFMFVAFITADVLVRYATRRWHERGVRLQREEALDIGLKLEYTDEAKSLKRVEVNAPNARILAVDDEAIILDTFRKILVLAGYSVDTVETGKEALGLVKKLDYDFVFTDLKMPGMDGLDVTKAVKHLRPDIDVIMITGYATIESAVDAMKYGALDYVQKPFTADELVTFIDKSLIRRQDRIERQIRPKIHLVTPTATAEESTHVFNVPAGLFISPEHEWLSVEMTGVVRIGLDDFTQKLVGEISEIILPRKDSKVNRGESLFSIKGNGQTLTFPSPVSGRVTAVNYELTGTIDILKIKPYEIGWICCIEATNLTRDLQHLKVGADAVSWYREEYDRFNEMVEGLKSAEREEGNGQGEPVSEEVKYWEAFSKSFLHA